MRLPKKEWLSTGTILTLLGLVLQLLIHRESFPVFLSEKAFWLKVLIISGFVISLLDLVLLLCLSSLWAFSLVKDYREKLRLIKKRFGILWKYEQSDKRFPDIYAMSDEKTGYEPIPRCPKHRTKLTNYKFMNMKDQPPVLLNWICEECRGKIIQPKEKGESETTRLTGSEAISRMRKWFNRI